MSIFNDVLVRKPGRSLFNLTHEKKFSANFGWLYPILIVDTVPGDTFKVSTNLLVRAAPLVAPVMHRVNIKLNYFFVPNRLLWSEWESFITGVDQTTSYIDSTQQHPYFVNPVKPFFKSTVVANDHPEYLQDGELADFLGFPTCRPNQTPDGTYNIDAMPFFAYNKIYVDWFRNENVEGGTVGPHASGENSHHAAYMHLQRRMWEKDYFTSALPFAQRGDPVQIPIAKEGSIVWKKGYDSLVRDPITGALIDNDNAANLQSKDGSVIDGASREKASIDNSDSLQVNPSVVGTINDLRVATRLQRWLEKNARVGGRYIEQILAHFGVRSSDARLQRAEYLGGFTLPLIIDEVEQNAQTIGLEVSGTDTPQGHLAGKGTAYGTSKPIKCYCEEHGFLIGLLSIIPRSAYQDGFPRMYQRNTRYDYYFPEFAHLGEQEVNKAELYFNVADASQQSKDRFGFQERYCEYKYIPSTVHGEFKNNLQFWHLGRSFTTQPVLNKNFVTCDPRDTIFAVEDENVANHFYINLINQVSAMRPMPKQAIPTL